MSRRKLVSDKSEGAKTLRLQREANQELVLSGLRAQEQADEARHAQREAEGVATDLRSSQAELRATAEFRELLIGIIGHDLRSPLSAIVMGGGLLIARGRLTEEDARIANRIVHSGQRMTKMIGQLAEFTQARLGGGFELHREPCDLGDVCRNVAEELRIGSFAEVRQTVQGDLHGSWDCNQLTAVVSNIAGNAVDYATPGTPIVIHAYDDGAAVVVEVTNQGPSIPPELLPVIFTAFRRAKVIAPERTGHLGLGMYISWEIARAHGGTLDVRSSDGTTTFTLRLPRLSAS